MYGFGDITVCRQTPLIALIAQTRNGGDKQQQKRKPSSFIQSLVLDPKNHAIYAFLLSFARLTD